MSLALPGRDRGTPPPPWSALAPYQREELDLGRGGLFRLHLAGCARAVAHRRKNFSLHDVPVFAVLHEGVAIGDQPRFGVIPAEHVAEDDFAGGETDRGTRDRRLAD